jgi:hypothetical protein
MKIFSLLALALLLGGCVTAQPIKLDPATASVPVEAVTVSVVDLTKQGNELRQHWVTTGFSRIPDNVFERPLAESLMRDLTSQLRPSGSGQAIAKRQRPGD